MESCLWPLIGGTRRERLIAGAMLVELWLIWMGLYLASWVLKG